MATPAHKRNKSDPFVTPTPNQNDTSNDEAIARAMQQSPQDTASILNKEVSSISSMKPRDRKGNSRSTTSSPVSPRKQSRSGSSESQGDKPAALRTGSRFFSKKTSQAHRRSRSSGDPKELTGRADKSSNKHEAVPAEASSTYIRLRGRFDEWLDQQRTAAATTSVGSPDTDANSGGPTLLTTRSLGPLLARLGIPKVAATEMTALLRAFLTQWENLCRQPTVDVDAMSQCVLSLYGLVEDKTRYKSSAWAVVDPELTDTAIELFERHVMELLYDLVFAADEADESKDLLLQEKIRKLRWVRAEHLHAKCDPDDPVVLKAFENAQDNLILMDSQRAPLDKLHRVVTASKTIFDLLAKGGNGSAAGADDFMPVLIYAIIKANPPMLYSNLQYVTRFCNPDKLNTGEAGYFYTNLYGAVEFITHMDAESLQMSPLEFDRQMQMNDFYKPAPTLKNHESLLASLERLAALSARQDMVRADLEKLNAEMNSVLQGNAAPIDSTAPVAEPSIIHPSASTAVHPDTEIAVHPGTGSTEHGHTDEVVRGASPSLSDAATADVDVNIEGGVPSGDVSAAGNTSGGPTSTDDDAGTPSVGEHTTTTDAAVSEDGGTSTSGDSPGPGPDDSTTEPTDVTLDSAGDDASSAGVEGVTPNTDVEGNDTADARTQSASISIQEACTTRPQTSAMAAEPVEQNTSNTGTSSSQGAGERGALTADSASAATSRVSTAVLDTMAVSEETSNVPEETSTADPEASALHADTPPDLSAEGTDA